MKLTGLLGLVAMLLVAPARADLSPVDSAPPQAPRVTVISDSVAATLLWHPDARNYLADGFDFRLEAQACRRLTVPGCLAYGVRPPSALATIQSPTADLGPVVVVDVGYNDLPDEYAAGIDPVMQALVSAHVQRVIWVTLAEHEDVWAENNATIRAAAKRWPELVVADWAPPAAANPGWLSDLAHMNADGAVGFAHFLRPILLAAFADCGDPCAPLAG